MSKILWLVFLVAATFDLEVDPASFTAHTDQPSRVSACKLPSSDQGVAAHLIVFH